ncbi:hypothetical protein CBR_g24379 [Chara braunii]|uniref:Uncharacterized protein n=1 Tax=Chara braunii TaxID=69332 RepID=A0A388JMV3_CHABU|nr:hypothetical protein CBR_g24379 [Chara braunii]|eukprot:GBG59032.1 hypothetical protein CBR_g24379 [Chara braunii]
MKDIDVTRLREAMSARLQAIAETKNTTFDEFQAWLNIERERRTAVLKRLSAHITKTTNGESDGGDVMCLASCGKCVLKEGWASYNSQDYNTGSLPTTVRSVVDLLAFTEDCFRHCTETVEKYGLSEVGVAADVWEHHHRRFCKQPYMSSNKRKASTQMVNHVRRSLALQEEIGFVRKKRKRAVENRSSVTGFSKEHRRSGAGPSAKTEHKRSRKSGSKVTVPSSAREISTLKERNESPPSTPVRGRRGSGAENRPPRAPEKRSRDDRSTTTHRRTKKRISYKDDRTVETIDLRGSDDRHSGPQVEEEEEHDRSAPEKSDGAEDEEPGNEGDDSDSSRRQSQDTDEDDDNDDKSASERTGKDQSATSERGGSPFPSRTLRREGERQTRNGSDTEERVGDRQIVQHVSAAGKVRASGGAVQGPKDESAAFAKKTKGKLLRSVAKAFAFSAANDATLYPTEDAFFAAVQATAKLAGETAEEGLRSHIAECGIRAVIGECNRMMTTIRGEITWQLKHWFWAEKGIPLVGSQQTDHHLTTCNKMRTEMKENKTWRRSGDDPWGALAFKTALLKVFQMRKEDRNLGVTLQQLAFAEMVIQCEIEQTTKTTRAAEQIEKLVSIKQAIVSSLRSRDTTGFVMVADVVVMSSAKAWPNTLVTVFGPTTPTELASQQATPMTIEIPEGEPAQRPQPPVKEGGPTEESPTILLEVQEGALTGAAASTEPEAMGGEASRLDELVTAMELDMPSREPQRQKTPERVPEMGGLRTQLGSWASGADSGEHISEQQQEVMSEAATAVTPQPSDLHRDEGATAMGGVREGRPLRLDTPAYRPEGDEMLAGPSTQRMDAGPTESWSMPQSHEMSRETSETPPLPGSQKKKRRCRGRSDDQCFFCTDGVHRALECPKFLKDKAAGRVTESGGRMYNRQGRVVERAPDGGRAQLHRQNQEAMSE